MNRYIEVFIPFKLSSTTYGFHIASNDNKITILSFNSARIVATADSNLDKSEKILAKQVPSNPNTFIIAGKDKITSSYIAQSYSFNSNSNTLNLLNTAYLDLNEISSKISKIGSLEITENSVFIGLEFKNQSFSTQILNLQNLTYVVANLTNEQKKTPSFLKGYSSVKKLIEVVNGRVNLYDLCKSGECLSCLNQDVCDNCRPDSKKGTYTINNFCYDIDIAALNRGN